MEIQVVLEVKQRVALKKKIPLLCAHLIRLLQGADKE